MSSEAESITRGEGISVHPIACLSDNYAYLLVDNKEKACAAVDPVNAERVLSTIKQLGLSLRCVLTTHHHSDHAGGNAELLSLLAADSSAAPVPVYGGDERVLALSHQVGHDDVIAVSERLSVRVLFTPCHTRGHVLYYAADPSSDRSVLFTGDTLFIGGCGRFFEGNGEQMDTALNHVIKALPASTQVYCGHEYTIANLEFAKSVEPHNEAIDRKLAWARAQRERGVPTVPSLLAEEFEYNPFMRLDSAEILSSLQLSSDAPIHERMDKLRVTKNNFK